MKSKLFIFNLLFIIGVSVNSFGQNEFITRWVVQPGVSVILIPTNTADYTYNYSVAWKKVGQTTNLGSISNRTGDYIINNITSGDTIEVKISGTFPHMKFNGSSTSAVHREKLIDVVQWGNNQWKSMDYMFYGCRKMRMSATDAPDLSQATSLSGMFYYCDLFNTNINHWNVSKITNMSLVFGQALVFDQPLDNWNVSSVTSMRGMFEYTQFNQPLEKWNVSKVQNMSFMFSASKFNQPLGKWNVSAVTNMEYMFQNVPYTHSLASWKISSVTNMSEMFRGTRIPYCRMDSIINAWVAIKNSSLPTSSWAASAYSAASATARANSGINFPTANVVNTSNLGLDAGSDVSICEGSGIMLTTGYQRYFVWNTGEEASWLWVEPTTSTWYSIHDGCGNYDSVHVDVINFKVDAGPDVLICDGKTDNLSLSTKEAFELYVWKSLSHSYITTTNSDLLLSDAQLVYGENLFSLYGSTGVCYGTDTISVFFTHFTEISLSGTTPICKSESSTISVSEIPSVTYVWNTGEKGSSITVSPLVTTTYTVTATDTYGCEVIDSFTVEVEDCLSVHDITNESISIYPNPASSVLTVKNTHRSTYVIRNLMGQVVLQGTFSNETSQIDITSLTNGLYFIALDAFGNQAQRFSVIR